jgi:NAD(P)-dependent dehydrogenase (short-subunit alcohol dehydrogenase family)
MPTVLVTGGNRGIGLELVRQHAAKGWQVLTTARKPAAASALQELGAQYPERIEIFELDVTSRQAVAYLASRLAGRPIDMLINNAGTFGPKGAPEGMVYQSLTFMDYGLWREMLEVNLLAPFHIAVELRRNLIRSERPVIVNMASGLASIENNTMGMSHAYRSSKAGLNMLTKGIAAEWQNIISISMAPGWCNTDLGGEFAKVNTAESVRDQLRTYDKLTLADSGRFIDRFGETVPW